MALPSAWARVGPTVTPEQLEALVRDAKDQLSGLTSKDLKDQALVLARAQAALLTAAQRLTLSLPADQLAELARRTAAQLGGLGFLNDLIYSGTLSEIAVNPDGSVWVMRKGAPNFERLADMHPSMDEMWRAVEALLTPLGRAFSEATPSVDAKLPRDLARNFSGARLKLIHSVLAPGPGQQAGNLGYPAINIRLFEARPVKPEQIVAWNMVPAVVMQALVEAVTREARVLVIGGTASGKTTFLSALCTGIPTTARVIKIEDPEEIFLEHPHVVTLEARPAPPGSSVPPYTIRDGVDDAMRMSPRWLVVGEMRKGDAAMSLFRAQMSDHPGLSTFHGESPEKAVTRLAVIMYADLGVRMEAAKEIFVEAVDLVVQVGFRETPEGRRRIVVGAWEVEPELRAGNVHFRSLYQPGQATLGAFTRR